MRRKLEAPLPPKEVNALPVEEKLRYPEYKAHADDEGELSQAVESPEQLQAFFHALTLSDLGYEGALTRVGHWGDSVLGNDGISSAIRRRMQARFGDGGHGFHALHKYDPSYRHQGIRFDEKGA